MQAVQVRDDLQLMLLYPAVQALLHRPQQGISVLATTM